jgi:hypothetical protein
MPLPMMFEVAIGFSRPAEPPPTGMRWDWQEDNNYDCSGWLLARCVYQAAPCNNSKPTKHHYHEETWSYDAATDTMSAGNTIKRVPLK